MQRHDALMRALWFVVGLVAGVFGLLAVSAFTAGVTFYALAFALTALAALAVGLYASLEEALKAPGARLLPEGWLSSTSGRAVTHIRGNFITARADPGVGNATHPGGSFPCFPDGGQGKHAVAATPVAGHESDISRQAAEAITHHPAPWAPHIERGESR